MREARARECRRSLFAWSTEALAPLGQRPAAHHRLLISALEDVVGGLCDRLMVLMPPGSAKSTYASVLFPAWFLAREPRSALISASHTAELAEHFGRRVRNLIVENSVTLGYGIAADNRAAGRWETTAGGTYISAGVGGAITGRRADLVLIDDPVKSQAEADSAAARNNAWTWYRSDLVTRLRPAARIVLVMTRWHRDDLGGRLEDEAAAGGDQWRVVRLPALAEADDPLGRASGAPLWPEWEDADALARKRAIVGPRAWSALFQQRPTAAEGLLFKAEKLGVIPALPAGGIAVRAWDLASVAGSGDWTVGAKLARLPDGRFVVADIVRLQGNPADVEAAIVNTAAQDGRAVQIGLPQDPGQAGKAQIAYLTSKLAGYRVISSPETGSKETRAGPLASQCEVGNVLLLQAPWNRTMLDEMRDFPAGKYDDQVDALSRAFGMLVSPGPIIFSPATIRRM